MSDEIIRKAVELADGWDITWEKMLPCDFTHITMPAGVTFYLEDRARPQWAIDALAAQLVRQVDAIRPKVKIDFTYEQTIVGDRLGVGLSPDRTMNTIKAIVGSGVLE